MVRISSSSTPYYIFDDNMVYYEPLISGPVLGLDSGGTDLTFYVPILPLIDIAGYFAFMEDPTTADTPIDSVVIRFSAISSEFVEYEPAQMKSVDLSKDNYLFVTTPPLQADKAYDVSLSINGQDFWPYNTTSADECFATQVGLEKTLRGKCISCDDDADCTSKCSGSVAPQGSHTPLSSCDRCCIHELSSMYSNFELAYADAASRTVFVGKVDHS